MRTTVTLDDDVFEIAQAQAQASGNRLGAVLSMMVRRGLQTNEATTNRRGLPVFKIRSGAKTIPTGRGPELLANESP